MAHLWMTAYATNQRNILSLAKACALEHQSEKSILDLGCDDGEWTLKVAEAFGAKQVHGIEIVKERAQIAMNRGLKVHEADLNIRFSDIADHSMDLVHANMVIEHIEKLDPFMNEIMRVLKPGGFAILSTENGSSWHNIIASIMGWQIFSSTNITTKANVGNPMAIYRYEPMTSPPSMMHKTIFYYLGFIEFFKAQGFLVKKVMGSGYYPLPSWVGQIDVRHSHFITALIEKPAS